MPSLENTVVKTPPIIANAMKIDKSIKQATIRSPNPPISYSISMFWAVCIVIFSICNKYKIVIENYNCTLNFCFYFNKKLGVKNAGGPFC